MNEGKEVRIFTSHSHNYRWAPQAILGHDLRLKGESLEEHMSVKQAALPCGGEEQTLCGPQRLLLPTPHLLGGEVGNFAQESKNFLRRKKT